MQSPSSPTPQPLAQRGPITLCGSLSLHPVGSGAAMHNAAYRALGLAFTYVPFGMTSALLPQALSAMRTLGIRGFGVSMPFKIEVMPLLDSIDPTAARIGAVNTIVNDNGLLTGHNTDWVGAVRALEEPLGPGGLHQKRVLLIGAGGAARAVAFGLVQQDVALTIINRTPERARSLAQEVGAQDFGGLDRLSQVLDYDVIVQASSAGMKSNPSGPLAAPLKFRPGQIVMDIVYDPIETDLVLSARADGATGLGGLRMLLHQAARQFELYTGLSAPLAVMNDVLRQQR